MEIHNLEKHDSLFQMKLQQNKAFYECFECQEIFKNKSIKNLPTKTFVYINIKSKKKKSQKWAPQKSWFSIQ